MAQNESLLITSPDLFRRCADHRERDEYWTLFVDRFNPVLVRSVTTTWRKHGPSAWLPPEIAEDLLQDVYANILKNDARLLRSFQGTTEAEAHAYLIQTATNQTLSYLRAQATQKRAADEVSLQALLENEGELLQSASRAHSHQTLSEWEFVRTLRHLFQGKDAERDILILLLYARDGYSPAEITRLKICDLKESSIANLLATMKKDLKKYLMEKR
jgi:DNA-directed RNA polymerase specialized sigma24 family protein